MRPNDIQRYVDLYRHMRTARRMDEMESELAQRGEASFHLAGAGHEGTAALALHVTKADWIHGHYRDKALFLALGFPLSGYLNSLLATGASDAKGRRMPPFIADRSRRMLSIPTLVGNNALQAVGVAASVINRPGAPVVFCMIGDGGSQQGEVLEAVAEAVRSSLPVLFIVEDNHLALSTETQGRTFYSLPDGEADSFYGLDVHRLDGSRVYETSEGVEALITAMRRDRRPRLLVLDLERLSDHSNSDDETVYRKAARVRRIHEERDPLTNLASALREAGVSEKTLSAVDAEVEADLQAAIAAARAETPPRPGPVKRPLPARLSRASAEARGRDGKPVLTLIESVRATLRSRLAADPRVSLYGQDIEDPKGDVFGVTRGLSRAFPGRVRNAPLSESTILGVSIGRALAGERPVAFLQFADFFPLAYNQIFSELGSLYWRSAGAWEAPVIILAVTGGYRPGLGPYHAQSPEAVMAHVPGLDVLMPATATDAAGLLQAAFASKRPTLLLYPKNLLNERAVLGPENVAALCIPIGRARVVRAGTDLTLVGWGNTVSICDQASEALVEAGVSTEVLDLRSLSPWDREAVCGSARRTGHLIVVHEDMHTCGLGGEVLATVAEEVGRSVSMARVTTPDTYLPFNYANQLELLPSVGGILEAAARMLDLELRWKKADPVERGIAVVRAMGSSPSDETVTLSERHAAEGSSVNEGQLLLSVEAEKASAEIRSPVEGVLEVWLADEGASLEVGTPVARIRAADPDWLPPGGAQPAATPVLTRKRVRRKARAAPAAGADVEVTLSGIHTVLGSREMRNEAFLHHFPEWNTDDVLQRTGIERRYWIGENEDALSLAVRACRELMDVESLKAADLDALICSTGTPPSMTPSLACRILREISPAKGDVMVQAYDLNAACSGYLYALQAAYDMLRSRPESRILVVTTETLSPVLDHTDPGTLFLFGDAASATLVAGEGRSAGGGRAKIHRPVLSAQGEDEKVLFVPFLGGGYVKMEGQQVFRVAVRKMVEMLERACAEADVELDDLSLIVPHQANNRIIESIRQRIKLPRERMFNHIRDFGNTSSNTIPLALQHVLPKQVSGDRIGLCAFGGGFTFGAAILDVL